MQWKRIIKKFVAIVILFLIIESIASVIDPIIENSLAIQQMEIDILSSGWIIAYQHFANCIPFVWVLIIILVFKNDFKELIKKMTDKNKENDNEEN